MSFANAPLEGNALKLFNELPASVRINSPAARERALYLETPAGRAEALRASTEQANAEYAAAIMSLPEAQDRPRAATKMALAYSAKSMPVNRAKLFLAGLPEEPTETANPKVNVMADPTLKRRAELRLAALSQRADQGDLDARAEAKRLKYALKVNAETTLSLPASLEMAGANVAAIR